MPPIQDHPLRYQLANELHARPFPAMTAPCTVVYLAIKRQGNPDPVTPADQGAKPLAERGTDQGEGEGGRGPQPGNSNHRR